MKQDKMYLINKIFNNNAIRTIWDKEKEKYYISVVDVVRVLSNSNNPQIYWRVLKKRLKDEGNEIVTNCNSLKLKSKDGKYRLTDVCDIEGMLRIIESIPSKNAEPIKQWLAHLGSERINETFDPSITVQRAIDTYHKKGYDEEWIIKRIKAIQDRKKLTDVWKENGIESDEWSGMTTKQYKEYKGLRKESLRDNMSDLEIALADLGELVTRELVKEHKPRGLKENMSVAKTGGKVAHNTRNNIEKELGKNVVIKDNRLNYEYIDNKLISKL